MARLASLTSQTPGGLAGAWPYDTVRERRDLSARRYVYIWADGVYLQARMEDDAACMLVIVGATPEGKKELVGFQVGVRESAQSWRELLVDLKVAASPLPPRSPSATAPWGSGRRSTRSSPPPDTSAAGSTSWSTS